MSDAAYLEVMSFNATICLYWFKSFVCYQKIVSCVSLCLLDGDK